jgi:hypothetical protein
MAEPLEGRGKRSPECSLGTHTVFVPRYRPNALLPTDENAEGKPSGDLWTGGILQRPGVETSPPTSVPVPATVISLPIFHLIHAAI